MTLYTRLQLLRAGIILTPLATAPVALAAGIDDASIGYLIAGVALVCLLMAGFLTGQRCPACRQHVLRRGRYWNGLQLPRTCPGCGDRLD